MTNLLVQWSIDAVVLAALATLAARIVPLSAASKRHAFWWFTLLAVLLLPWIDTRPAASSAEVASVGRVAVPAAVLTPVTLPEIPEWLAVAGLGCWCAWTLVAAGRIMLDLRAVRRLTRASRPLDPGREERLATFSRIRRGTRPVAVRIADDLRGACAVGFFNPQILLSAGLSAALDDEAVEAIVLHEHAHLRRYDDWTRLAERIVMAAVGWHPAVWWVARQIDIEREAACDRAVVDQTGAPATYVRALATAAECAATARGVAPLLAPGAFTGGSGLHARALRIITIRRTSRWVDGGASAAGVGLLALAIVSTDRMPPLVTLEAVHPLDVTPPILPVPLATSVALIPEGQSSQEQEAVTASPERPTNADVTPVEQPPVPVLGVPDLHDSFDPVAETIADSPAPLLTSAPVTQGYLLLKSNTGSLTAKGEPSGPAAIGVRTARAGSAVGDAATRAGIAMSDAATRTGTSVAHWFANSGRAVASRF